MKMDHQPPSKRLKIPACANCGIHMNNLFCELCRILMECDRCHKRLHQDLFSTNSSICLTCKNNRSRQRNYTFNDVFTVTTIPSDETCRDLEAYILGSSNLILEAIDRAIQQQKLVSSCVLFLLINRNSFKSYSLNLFVL